MSKKIVSIALSVLLILCFVGCNKDEVKEITSPEDLIGMSKAEIEEIYELSEDSPSRFEIKEDVPNNILDELKKDYSLEYFMYCNFEPDESDCYITYFFNIENEEKNIALEKVNTFYDKVLNNTKKDITYEGSHNKVTDITENNINKKLFLSCFEETPTNFV